MSKTNPRVLVVEDEPSWHKLILRCEFLDQIQQINPKSVIVVKSYEEAKNKLNTYQFDLAITDLVLEKGTGQYEWRILAGQLLEQRVPVVVLSGYLDDVHLMSDMVNEYGVVGIFHKGTLDPHRLSDHLKNIIHVEDITTTAAIEIESTPEHKGKITMLHLSDLHCGIEHRFSSRYRSNDLPHSDIPNLSQAIINDLEQQDISIDAIVVSGDLSHSGEIEQFRWARETIEDLAMKLEISFEHLIIVPGNHDIKWLKEKDKSLPYHELSSSYQSFYELVYKKKPKDKERLFHVSFIKEKNIAIVGLDSCVIEGTETAGIGYIGATQLNRALNEMQTLTKGHDNCVKVAVLHHHLIPVEKITNVPGHGKNFSIVMDSSIVMRRLYQEDFAIILHGHQHQPYCADIRIHDIKRTSPIAVIGTGSVGVERSKLGNIARNHYSIIEIETSANDTKVHVTGRVSSTYNEDEFEQHNEITFNIGGKLGILK